MTRSNYIEFAEIFGIISKKVPAEAFNIFVNEFCDEIWIRHSSFKRERFLKAILKSSNGQSAIPTDDVQELNS